MSTSKENCKPEAGLLAPIVNWSKCDGKTTCVEVCPYDVFGMDEISDEQFKALPFFGRLKTRLTGRTKAFVLHPEACHSCGLCVQACPEKAIKLSKSTP